MVASFPEAAYKILKEENQPLSTTELTRRALDEGLISSKGKTPNSTMWASIYLENQRRIRRKEQPRFKQYSGHIWGLTEWGQ